MTDLQPYQEIGSPLSATVIKHQIQVIQEVMRDAMVKDTHYGVIPGCGDKPTLLKPGAEKLCLTFRLAPTYTVIKTDLPNGHREYEVRCTLTHIPTQSVYGEGVGTCSTMESKYHYRQAERVCPNCGKATIIKGRAEFGGGWLCFGKKGGCGSKFGDFDETIMGQVAGRVDNPDLADVYNTVLKMSKKRAHVDAVLTATAASDIFAQDLEDLPRTTEPVIEATSEVVNSEPSQPPARETTKVDYPKNLNYKGATPTPTVKPEPAPNGPPITVAQTRTLVALCHGKGWDDEETYRQTSEFVGRVVESFKGLSTTEASGFADYVKGLGDGS